MATHRAGPAAALPPAMAQRAPAAGLPLALDARAAEPLTPAPVASLARPPAADGRRCPGPSAVARGAAAAVAARLFVGGRARRKPSAACSPATGSRATARDHDALSDLRDVNLSKREADWRRLFQEDECDCERIVGTVVDVPGLLSAQECDALVAAADRRASQVGWRAAQHLNYRTDDVKVRTLGDPDAIELFRSRVEGPLIAQIERSFGLPAEDVVAFDSFIVRYAAPGGKTSLASHRDGSIVSATVSLSDAGAYRGGGTRIDEVVYRPSQGGAVLFGGARVHSGEPITWGTRYVATIFFRCRDFDCHWRTDDEEPLWEGSPLTAATLAGLCSIAVASLLTWKIYEQILSSDMLFKWQ